jgi:S-adenosylmethionine:tRNA ribosyltransferase-isomerase
VSDPQTLDAYTYDLPKERIAQRPCHPADHAKMLVIDRKTGALHDRFFYDLPEFLSAKDRLVFNDTRVIPARLFGTLDSSGQAAVELLLIEKITDARWVCIGRPLKKIRAKGKVKFGDTLWAEVIPDDSSTDRVTVEFHTSEATHISMAIATHGCMPIPPYIRGGKGDELDEVDYQTIFARNPGSVAAPTASLHFNEELMGRLTTDVRCDVSRITLHVGTASFLPVLDNGKLRPPGSERFHVTDEATREMLETRNGGGRVIAVGTTVVRALESSAREGDSEATELFITPGYRFQRVDSVITNFHQPGTTHLLLVEALLGRELLAKAYEHALANDYRFLSYGDGMLIL